MLTYWTNLVVDTSMTRHKSCQYHSFSSDSHKRERFLPPPTANQTFQKWPFHKTLRNSKVRVLPIRHDTKLNNQACTKHTVVVQSTAQMKVIYHIMWYRCGPYHSELQHTGKRERFYTRCRIETPWEVECVTGNTKKHSTRSCQGNWRPTYDAVHIMVIQEPSFMWC